MLLYIKIKNYENFFHKTVFFFLNSNCVSITEFMQLNAINFQTINLFSVTVRNILSYGLGNVLSYVSLSLFTQHKVAKGYISMTTLQKKKAGRWSSLTIKVRKSSIRFWSVSVSVLKYMHI